MPLLAALLSGGFATWVLRIIVLGAIAALVITTFIIFSAWVEPKLKRMNKEIKPVKGFIECCPPGLGCNDPVQAYQKCLRQEARRIATVDELLKLDELWSIFSGIPYRQKTNKVQAQAAYAAQRDSIIARALGDAAERLNAHRKLELPAHIADPPARGEVV